LICTKSGFSRRSELLQFPRDGKLRIGVAQVVDLQQFHLVDAHAAQRRLELRETGVAARDARELRGEEQRRARRYPRQQFTEHVLRRTVRRCGVDHRGPAREETLQHFTQRREFVGGQADLE
jgi:hypothetical protein